MAVTINIIFKPAAIFLQLEKNTDPDFVSRKSISTSAEIVIVRHRNYLTQLKPHNRK